MGTGLDVRKKACNKGDVMEKTCGQKVVHSIKTQAGTAVNTHRASCWHRQAAWSELVCQGLEGVMDCDKQHTGQGHQYIKAGKSKNCPVLGL